MKQIVSSSVYAQNKLQALILKKKKKKFIANNIKLKACCTGSQRTGASMKNEQSINDL